MRRWRTAARLGCLALVLAATLTQAAQAADPGLVAQWHLDQVTAATTPDSSGRGLTGSGVAGVLVPGRFGQALNLGGAPNGFRAGPNGALEPQRLTVMAWVRGGPQSSYRQIVIKGGQNCAAASWALNTGPDGGLRFTITFDTAVDSPSSVDLAIDNKVAPAAIWDSQWHAIAGTFDGATARLYVDGVERGSAPKPAPATSILYDFVDRRLAVGRYPQDSDGAVGLCSAIGFQFLGAVDEPRIYDRALNALELAYLQRPGTTEPPSLPTSGGGGGAGSGGGGGGGGGGTAGPPAARLTVPGVAKALARTTLDASATTGVVSRFDWDLNSDGTTDASCGGRQPRLIVRPLGARTQNVTLTAVGTGGLKSVARGVLRSSGAAPPEAAARLSAVAVCQAIARIDLTAGGGPPAGCTTTVDYGLASAIGCFQRVQDPDKVPSGERATLNALVAEWNRNPPLRGLTRYYCSNVEKCEGEKADAEALIEATDLYASPSTVRLNGLDVTPRRGATVVFHPQLGRIVSKDATVRLGDATLIAGGALNLDVSARKGRRVALGSFSGVRGLPSLGKFLPTGTVGVALAADGAPGTRGNDVAGTVFKTPSLTNRRSEITLALAMPSIFSVFGGRPPTANTVASAANDRGFTLDALSVRVPSLSLGGARLTDVSFDYLRSDPSRPCSGRSSWRGGGNLFFGPTGEQGLRFTKPPSERGIGFCGSSLSYAGGDFTFGVPGPPAPQIFPGVFLESIGFGVGFEPTRFNGRARLTAAKITEINGTLLAAFASPEEPYTLTREDAGGGLAKVAGTYERAIVAVGGTASIKGIPVLGRLDLGSGYLMFGAPDYLRVGGSIRADIPGGSVEGRADGEVGIGSGRFNLEVGGRACTVLCYGGVVLVSSSGLAACGEVTFKIPPIKLPLVPQTTVTWKPGIGWRYGEIPTIYLWGCDVGPFRAQVSAAAVDGSRTFTVPKGSRQQLVRLTGAGGAPDVEVRGPGGEIATTAYGSLGDSGTIRILRQADTGVTWIGVGGKLKPGTYTITPRAGSPAIATLASAPGLAPARVKASVAGTGERRVLRYDVGARPGQKVTFLEQGASTNRALATVASGRGSVRFAPGAGDVGRHRIVARVELGGLARQELDVATFRVAKPRKPGRPSRLKLRRKGGSLTVSWKAASGAARWVVVVTPKGGAEKVYRLPGKRRSAKLEVAATQAGSVAIHALTGAGDAGKVAAAGFRSTKKPPTRFRPFAELRRK